ncbi:MAG: hypothetical protein P1U63_11505 [Coxiellaceae bacterium]|nr:hypothetical protein [Coxiellaceae bacterium]
MNKLWVVLLGVLTFNIVTAQSLDPYMSQAQQAYQQAKNNKIALKQWVADIPKGGDLHNHFTGAIYRDQLIQLADDDIKHTDYCANMSTDKVTVDANCINDKGEWLRAISTGSDDYHQLIDAWTMQDFHYQAPSFGESHFFATFGEVGALTHDTDYYPQLLANMMQQAANEHLDYIELMLAMDSYDAQHSAASMGKHLLKSLDTLQSIDSYQVNRAADLLIENGIYDQVVLPHIIKPTRKMVADAKQLLHCDGTAQQAAACKVVVRFQYQLIRVTSPSQVFASMVAGMLANHYAPDLYVTENLVAPESNAKSIQYYQIHMQMLKYLNQYAVNHYGQRMPLSEHAGELTANDTAKTNLHDHIYQAINVAGADRIGHGVDIGYELKSFPGLLAQLADQHKLIEVNLTSNQDILGVCDGPSYCMDASPGMKSFHHPLMRYINHHVPVALSTDDQGVSNTSLNHEYYMAVSRYPLSYQQIKNIDRNSLYYAFIQGENLWQDSNYQHLVAACAEDNPYTKMQPSVSCQGFLNKSPKAQLQWRLEKQFAVFEAGAN